MITVDPNAQADDGDENGTDNAIIRYRIFGGDARGNFTLDSLTGQLRPKGVLDFEAMDKSVFNLTVRAQDLGTPSLHEDVTVLVHVHDVNDHPPEFQKSLYFTTIPETIQPGEEVIQVKAFDQDRSAPNNEVIYRLGSGANDKFVIDVNGLITVRKGANLDPDLASPRVNRYKFEVFAFDGGIGSDQLSGSSVVEVKVTDVNNKLPEFSRSSRAEVTVMESASIGHFVTKVNATDSDEDARIIYSLDSKISEIYDENASRVDNLDIADFFEVDAIGGEIRVSGHLDRERFAMARIAVVAEDLNAETAQRSIQKVSVIIIGESFRVIIDKEQRLDVYLLVSDVNDNRPEFSFNEYHATVSENSAKGFSILKVEAHDKDVKKTINYSMEGSADTLALIDLDTKSGVIRVGQDIDFEQIRWLNLSVRAADTGIPTMSSVAQVSIKVIDQNDNSPKFEPEFMHFKVEYQLLIVIFITYDRRVVPQVSESTPAGSVIGRLRARDPDSGDYGVVTYFLDQRATLAGKFKVTIMTYPAKDDITRH